MRVCQPIDKVAQEFFGCPVHPVKIIHHEDEGPVFTVSDQKISNCLKDPGPFLFGLQCVPGWVIYSKGKKVLVGGQGTQEVFIQGPQPLIHPVADVGFPVFVCYFKKSPEDIKHGKKRNGAAELQAPALQIVACVTQAGTQFQDEP